MSDDSDDCGRCYEPMDSCECEVNDLEAEIKQIKQLRTALQSIEEWASAPHNSATQHLIYVTAAEALGGSTPTTETVIHLIPNGVIDGHVGSRCGVPTGVAGHDGYTDRSWVTCPDCLRAENERLTAENADLERLYRRRGAYIRWQRWIHNKDMKAMRGLRGSTP